MKSKKGMFITFEGPDGSGKSTQMNLVCDYLSSKGYDCVCTREPGGTKVGEKLRDILMDTTLNEKLSIKTEVLLLQTARAQHVHEVIMPALLEDKVVLCDRYADSSTAYQGIAHGVGKEVICQLNNFSTSGLVPDLTILLDLSPEKGLQRAEERLKGQKKDRWEELDVKYHEKVRNAFLQLAKENPGRYRVISTAGTVEETHQKVVDVLNEKLKIKN